MCGQPLFCHVDVGARYITEYRRTLSFNMPLYGYMLLGERVPAAGGAISKARVFEGHSVPRASSRGPCIETKVGSA